MRVTLDFIAEQAGVSKATVSNVLNRCGSVSPKRREEILALMARHEYKPVLRRKSTSRAASGLKHGAVAVLLPSWKHGTARSTFGSEYINTLLSGAERASKPNSLNLMMATPDEKGQLPDCIRSGRVDGVIAVSTSELPVRPSMPVVRVFSPLLSSSHDLVLSDHEAIGHAAAQQLLEAGCKRCAFVNPHAQHQGFAVRKRAFVEALKRHHVRTKAFEVNYQGDPAKIAALVKAVLKGREAPDGIFLPGSDREVAAIAFELQKQSARPLAGRKVVSCVSNIELLEPMNLGMDFIDIQLEDIGAAAVNTLVWRVQNPAAALRRVMVQPMV